VFEVLRVAFESGAFAWAVVLAIVLVVGGIVRHCLQVAPTLVRELSRRAVIRQAICGRTKADREQACRVLELLQSKNPEERDGKELPNSIDVPDD
jgi:hypothetical protein